jgi:hypothetical protein
MQSPVGVQGAKPPWAGAGRRARMPNPLRQEIGARAGRSDRIPNPLRQGIDAGAGRRARRRGGRPASLCYNSA